MSLDQRLSELLDASFANERRYDEIVRDLEMPNAPISGPCLRKLILFIEKASTGLHFSVLCVLSYDRTSAAFARHRSRLVESSGFFTRPVRFQEQRQ